MKIQINKLPVVTLAIVGLIFSILQIAHHFILFNISSSMPFGFYQIERSNFNSQYSHGDIVAVCLNKTDQDFGLKRNYIFSGTGCEGSEPLIKSIFAVPGDTIILHMDTIVLNGNAFNYPTLLFDSDKRPLNIYKRGVYPHTSQYWLIGTHSTKSWDSRYWGPVLPSQILFKLKPLLTWN